MKVNYISIGFARNVIGTCECNLLEYNRQHGMAKVEVIGPTFGCLHLTKGEVFDASINNIRFENRHEIMEADAKRKAMAFAVLHLVNPEKFVMNLYGVALDESMRMIKECKKDAENIAYSL